MEVASGCGGRAMTTGSGAERVRSDDGVPSMWWQQGRSRVSNEFRAYEKVCRAVGTSPGTAAEDQCRSGKTFSMRRGYQNEGRCVKALVERSSQKPNALAGDDQNEKEEVNICPALIMRVK